MLDLREYSEEHQNYYLMILEHALREKVLETILSKDLPRTEEDFFKISKEVCDELEENKLFTFPTRISGDLFQKQGYFEIIKYPKINVVYEEGEFCDEEETIPKFSMEFILPDVTVE